MVCDTVKDGRTYGRGLGWVKHMVINIVKLQLYSTSALYFNYEPDIHVVNGLVKPALNYFTHSVRSDKHQMSFFFAAK